MGVNWVAALYYREMGVDGLMTWFARWPHGDIERAWLGQIGDPDLLCESSKVGTASLLLLVAFGPQDLDIPAC